MKFVKNRGVLVLKVKGFLFLAEEFEPIKQVNKRDNKNTG
jgi:hypothetical protein